MSQKQNIANSSSEAATFLTALFAGKPDESHILLWTLPEKQSYWFQDLKCAIQVAETHRDHDLYVGIGLSTKDYGPTRRCPSNEIAGIVGLWADLDLKSDAHSNTALPSTVEEAVKILPRDLPPTFLILTGHGVHAWWLFKEPLVFESEQDRSEAIYLANRWQTLLRAEAAALGWAFVRLADLARLLRVPGTRNCKDPARTKPVEIYQRSNRRYNPSDLEEYLDEREIPDIEAQEKAAQEWREKVADKPWTIDPSAVVPEDLLHQYLEGDGLFQKTWHRRRDDLKDQSQSGYDLALANFGSRAGLSEQQIVDLIVHHRRIHGERQRTRSDYFQRTIAKAFSGSNGLGPVGLLEQFSPLNLNGHAESDQQSTKPDSATARALLCEQISAVLGVRILRIVKITGKEPTYQVELETDKVEFSSVSKLVNQRSFSMAIASAADRLIPKIKPKEWEGLAQRMLDALTIQDGGEETDLVGSARIHLENYLSETQFIDFAEDQPIFMRRRPTKIEGHIAICAGDFQTYIDKTNNECCSVKTVASMLTALGASSKRIRGAHLRDQSRWLLPVAEFPASDYPGPTKEAPGGQL